MNEYFESGEVAKETVMRYYNEIIARISAGAKISFESNDYISKHEKEFKIVVHYNAEVKA